MNKKVYTNLVFSGGSTKGIAHIGAYHQLVEEGLIDFKQLKAVAGTSAGALMGILVVLGFTPIEIWDFIQNLNFKKMFDFNIDLYTKCGVNDGSAIRDLIENILLMKTGIKHINFKQLHAITGIDFTVVGTCLTDKIPIYYNHVNTPTFKVSIAIRISTGMPGYFTPVDIDGKKYIDGSCLNNYPMSLFDHDMDNTIGIRICTEYDTEYNCPEQFLVALFNLFASHFFAKELTNHPNNTVFINDTCGLSIVSFDLDLETKKKIYRCGIDGVNNFVAKK